MYMIDFPIDCLIKLSNASPYDVFECEIIWDREDGDLPSREVGEIEKLADHGDHICFILSPNKDVEEVMLFKSPISSIESFRSICNMGIKLAISAKNDPDSVEHLKETEPGLVDKLVSSFPDQVREIKLCI